MEKLPEDVDNVITTQTTMRMRKPPAVASRTTMTRIVTNEKHNPGASGTTD
jgi:hypothetical protein